MHLCRARHARKLLPAAPLSVHYYPAASEYTDADPDAQQHLPLCRVPTSISHSLARARLFCTFGTIHLTRRQHCIVFANMCIILCSSICMGIFQSVLVRNRCSFV